MHQIRLRLGLHPIPHWESLQHSPRSLSWISEVVLLRKGRGSSEEGEREGRGNGREGKVKGAETGGGERGERGKEGKREGKGGK